MASIRTMVVERAEQGTSNYNSYRLADWPISGAQPQALA
jgi:hypothetical protein